MKHTKCKPPNFILLLHLINVKLFCQVAVTVSNSHCHLYLMVHGGEEFTDSRLVNTVWVALGIRA